MAGQTLFLVRFLMPRRVVAAGRVIVPVFLAAFASIPAQVADAHDDAEYPAREHGEHLTVLDHLVHGRNACRHDAGDVKRDRANAGDLILHLPARFCHA